MSKKYQSRRSFLKRSAYAALLGSSGSAFNGKMSLIGSALAAEDGYSNLPGYKALVCVFLYGGSDSFNMFVPYPDDLYGTYQQSRGSLAIGRDALISDASRSVYFHPNLGALRDSYDAGNLAIVRNVGNLIKPVTPAQFQNNPALIPADLFAHNSQQEQVLKSYSSQPVGLVGEGWGGRMADLLMEANQSRALPPTFSVNNANFFQPGRLTSPISVNPLTGPKLLPYLDGTSRSANQDRDASMERILALESTNLLEQFASNSFKNARDSSRVLSRAVDNSIANQPLGPVDLTNPIDAQLRMVARLIDGRQDLQMSRQIFFVGLGGWDTHDNQTPRLNGLTTNLNAGIANFQQALERIGVANDVTLFTASDFGRTLTINGDGSDHGWGGHYMVMGGAVNGGQLYGNWPDYTLGGSQDIGKGRLIPELSLNQYGAALASWMGVCDSDLDSVFPDLRNFGASGLDSLSGLFNT